MSVAAFTFDCVSVSGCDTFDWTVSRYRDAASFVRKSPWLILTLCFGNVSICSSEQHRARCAGFVVDVSATGTEVGCVEFAVIPRCWQLLHSLYSVARIIIIMYTKLAYIRLETLKKRLIQSFAFLASPHPPHFLLTEICLY